jgi:hypothetical protein
MQDRLISQLSWLMGMETQFQLKEEGKSARPPTETISKSLGQTVSRQVIVWIEVDIRTKLIQQLKGHTVTGLE